ncbi:MAG: tetratricopeptide repeat protein, partial [Candidatus Acidiferrales bacterium]
GSLYMNKGDSATARKYFAQAVDADPNYAVAISNLAWLDAQDGKNLDVALGMAQKAEQLMPQSPSITDTLAWVMYKRGDYAGATQLLRECVQKAPSSAEFHYHLGMSLMAQGQKAEAKGQLENALRLKLEASEATEAQRAIEGTL